MIGWTDSGCPFLVALILTAASVSGAQDIPNLVASMSQPAHSRSIGRSEVRRGAMVEAASESVRHLGVWCGVRRMRVDGADESIDCSLASLSLASRLQQIPSTQYHLVSPPIHSTRPHASNPHTLMLCASIARQAARAATRHAAAGHRQVSERHATTAAHRHARRMARSCPDG
jgi:hypothetical protein